jgi:hypothetical protein
MNEKTLRRELERVHETFKNSGGDTADFFNGLLADVDSRLKALAFPSPDYNDRAGALALEAARIGNAYLYLLHRKGAYELRKSPDGKVALIAAGLALRPGRPSLHEPQALPWLSFFYGAHEEICDRSKAGDVSFFRKLGRALDGAAKPLNKRVHVEVLTTLLIYWDAFNTVAEARPERSFYLSILNLLADAGIETGTDDNDSFKRFCLKWGLKKDLSSPLDLPSSSDLA